MREKNEQKWTIFYKCWMSSKINNRVAKGKVNVKSRESCLSPSSPCLECCRHSKKKKKLPNQSVVPSNDDRNKTGAFQ